jgi:succinate-semialdehyde dehydrogenase/glutarate-semialdehyde dehydrogenase
MATLESINPFNGEINKTYETLSDEQITEKIEKAQSAFLEWKDTSFDERKELFHKLADVIEAGHEEFAKLQTLEM